MPSDLVLIDTSSWIEALRPKGNPHIVSRVRELLHDGRACWCDVVTIELWNGARGKAERSVLAEFQRTLICLEVNAAVWSASRKVALVAKQSGISAPTVDIIIMACAFVHEVPMEHCDKHLALLDELRTKI